MESPVAFSTVLREEHDQLKARRAALDNLLSDEPASPPVSISDSQSARDLNLNRGLERAHSLRPFGVCLSGGGIRSATFNLGILQGLTERGLLPFIDYLSTVSGGGYIGSWLHGVIRNKCHDDPREARGIISPTTHQTLADPVPKLPGDATHDPITFLRKYSNYLAPRLGLFSPDFWVIAVIWLRNMLLNQLILVPFLAGIVLFSINAGHLQQWLARGGPNYAWFASAVILLFVPVVIIAGNLGEIVKREFQQPAVRPDAGEQRWIERLGPVWVAVGCVLGASLILGASRLNPIPDGFTQLFKSSTALIDLARLLIFLVLWLLFFVAQRFGGFKQCFRRRHADHPDLWWLHLVWMPLASAAGTAALLYEVLRWISAWQGADSSAWSAIAYGPPLVVVVLLAGAAFHVGLMGADLPDAAREWLARFAALLFISGAAWMALFSLGVFGPWWTSDLALRYAKTTSGLAGTWIATTVAGILAGKSSRTSGENGRDKTSGALEWISKVAPTVFMIGYLLAISFAVYEIMAHSLVLKNPPVAESAPFQATLDFTSPVPPATGSSTLHVEVTSGDTLLSWLRWLRPIHDNYWFAYDLDTDSAWLWPLVDLAVCGALVLVLPLRFNINEFSLHHFYKNRLVRCYLGAGRGNHRRPNLFTGFDTHDDFPIAALRAVPPDDEKKAGERQAQSEEELLIERTSSLEVVGESLDAKVVRHEVVAVPRSRKQAHSYLGPYPIVNTTLNLNAGSELATQERKGSSFVFTPLYSGFDPPHSAEDDAAVERQSDELRAEGYCETCSYMYPASKAAARRSIGGPGIGTAVGISGAAANPNDGFHTSGPMAFLLTIFDVRLGWWVGNPRRRGPSRRPGPRYALLSLISELFGQTTERSNYLNLSDGGHFENLGLYELIKRRCRYIIVCDAEEDGKYKFESLGAAIRKCRTDFGVEIDLDPTRIHPDGDLSQTHCVVGSITYPEVATDGTPGPATGWLLYLKSSVTGDEPDDVKQYKSGHSNFPQEPTADQFFTESQFESYRRLGLHVVESTFENLRDQVRNLQDHKTHVAMEALFRGLCEQWYPPSTIAEGVATRHAEAYSALMQRLSSEPDLRYLDSQVIPRLGKNCNQPPPRPDEPPDWVDEKTQRKAQLYCLDLIQLMENVWMDLHLYNAADRRNPKNTGWMRMFKHWVTQPVFERAWRQASCTYSDLFRQFFEQLQREEQQHGPAAASRFGDADGDSDW